MILDKINYPTDLKKIELSEMETLAEEMRKLIIEKVNITGGHFGPNLGIVEATIAMHYVFNTPRDKIVFDVSHQCYPHKMLTGRKAGFLNKEDYLKYTGYTAPEESEYDLFKVGHTSTSVSLAVGVAKARDIKGENYNVIALIGDGSLSGGEAFEGLDNGAVLNSNFIVVVNDNDQSIAENHGGIYKNLKNLRETNGKAENNYFKSLGYDYYFVKDGNNIKDLIETFKKVKDIDHPVVVHIYTQKGKGYKDAEQYKENFHWILPGALDEKKSENQFTETFESLTKDYLLKKVKEDKSVVILNAGTPGVFGFNSDFRKELGDNYVDVGIAEEHAVACASAIAKEGGKPVMAVMSSFVQRTYDQLSQDLALNNSPAVILVYWGGISSADATHLCTFDIPMISNIPNLVYLSPAYKEEYLKMLDWAIEQKEHPVVIRVPSIETVEFGEEDRTDYSVLNKYQKISQGENIAIIGLGGFCHKASELKKYLDENLNVNSTLINPRFITGVDSEMLEELKKNHKIVITLEDGEIDGGFGEKISRYYANSDIKVLNYGSLKEFTDRVPMTELVKRYRLRNDLICEDVMKLL